ncbi:Aminoacyl-tRNA synthetase, class II (G/ H/ P/ S), conserved domain protein [Kalmanozyma brasiliensis GHG001]|uniref:serine--tRNA ligase n=1 Tax=Kalmanozyma brasiliensis (strain GHG001) TaxID=1365824 RepID=V5GWC5_KALBG|nr:Aminoacyl-tRNA synthetase, class II (G/ H/ P/ S), conserved domain protein [Kalmanozyma brasiliensis GHG001]EST10197.1 Aminoacyl-tRNA synthetase, class II (G/ H/ P/ S), conserved domain protein [Kalmanozyma brasiliensis GHG001]
MIDLLLLQPDKGGNPQLVKDSQKKRNAPEELVDEVLALYKNWVSLQKDLDVARRDVNAVQAEITKLRKAKENADEQMAKKKELDAKVNDLKPTVVAAEQEMKTKAMQIGNIVGDKVPISNTEDDNAELRKWHPDGPNAQVEKKEGILSHHEVMYRLELFDTERGTKISGHRGFFLTGDGVDLNQALINYGLDFLRKKNYKKIMTPFMMRKEVMAKTAQLDQFDEELYKVTGDEDDKYLIATSEQPISALHSDEVFTEPAKQLPIRYAGYSTCFRKEAGSHGKDTWGIFRVHQFEKVEQFCITDPASSWEMLDQMLANSEEFYQSLQLPYHVVAIVSGALNNAAAAKYDLEAWFPFQGEYKELVSCSNCTDYQSRRLDVRCGFKKPGDTKQTFVHMLNGTLCATERALCCVVENWQTEDGLKIPPVLQPYMQGRDFLPYVRELPKNTTSQKKK